MPLRCVLDEQCAETSGLRFDRLPIDRHSIQRRDHDDARARNEHSLQGVDASAGATAVDMPSVNKYWFLPTAQAIEAIQSPLPRAGQVARSLGVRDRPRSLLPPNPERRRRHGVLPGQLELAAL